MIQNPPRHPSSFTDHQLMEPRYKSKEAARAYPPTLSSSSQGCTWETIQARSSPTSWLLRMCLGSPPQSTRRNWTLYRLLPQKLFCRTGQLLDNKAVTLNSEMAMYWCPTPSTKINHVLQDH